MSSKKNKCKQDTTDNTIRLDTHSHPSEMIREAPLRQPNSLETPGWKKVSSRARLPRKRTNAGGRQITTKLVEGATAA